MVHDKKRNIVVFLCDQLRRDFLPVYGFKAIQTPNIDRLASVGVVFDRAITVSTVCAPARASMMTGRYVSDHGVWTNDMPFRDGLDYIAERMDKLGYATGAFGKLHHYPALDSKGFKIFYPMEENRLGQDEPYLKWLKQRHPEITNVWNHCNYEFIFTPDEYYEHWIASRAISFIQEKSNGSDPFFAWVSFQGPHGPHDPPHDVKGSCKSSLLPPLLKINHSQDEPPVVKYRRALYGMPDEDKAMQERVAYAEKIVAIDREIGRILECLEATGRFDETTFIFTADHGDMLGDYSLDEKGPLPFGAQLSIPLIISNHPRLKQGTRSSSLSNNIDVPGTMLDIAGDQKGIGCSFSLLDLAQPNPEHPRTVNFSEFCDSIKTVENERFKFSYFPFQRHSTLYDIKMDPYETTSLSEYPEYTEIKMEMLAHVIDFMILAKGVRIEAHDMVTEQREGIIEKYPKFQRDFTIAFPLSANDRDRLIAEGLPADINEFCRGADVMRTYCRPYWEEKS
jgi:arylsulfatase A-like enzyme